MTDFSWVWPLLCGIVIGIVLAFDRDCGLDTKKKQVLSMIFALLFVILGSFLGSAIAYYFLVK